MEILQKDYNRGAAHTLLTHPLTRRPRSHRGRRSLHLRYLTLCGLLCYISQTLPSASIYTLTEWWMEGLASTWPACANSFFTWLKVGFLTWPTHVCWLHPSHGVMISHTFRHLRHALLCFTAASALECRNGVFSFDVLIDRETSLLIRVCRQAETEGLPSIVELEKPLSSDTVPVIIFFHGGSFVHSSSDSTIYDTLCRCLVGICKAVVWVSSKPWLQSRKDSKVHIYLAGDGSGGNIVHNVAVRFIESGIELMGNILLNPSFSGQKRTESEKRLDGKYFVKIQERDWYWRAFLPEGEDMDHPACNPFGPNGISLEVIKFPKSLVVVAGLDLI
ncbi:hypothetical protein TEA_026217 [Camellia sinensis var. sinensis]|uniref:Alpha/beta hydrolase fold-3 domain-containing protein n=1 Tax=Camellia sinensis var. sinensis TaxID=542762 RepID=A0A4S4EM17_CAMSN|nr:hypothetical protein TEA_026217 [Camellia sinensis var. sinensis]